MLRRTDELAGRPRGRGWRISSILLAFAAAIHGCGGVTRTARDTAYLMKVREDTDAHMAVATRQRFVALLENANAEQVEFQAKRRPSPPVIDILIISGGGDWGAFGAGFLKGWGKVPDNDPMALPRFDVVTGVSTGALIAPFAFIGDDESIAKVEHLYRNPQKDWVRDRGFLFFLPQNASFAEIPGLERELKESVSMDVARRIAESGKQGRILVVNTTNLDDASPRAFDVIAEAERAVQSGDMSRLHDVMLASAGIPAAFPYREIDGSMYVDGGATGNISYGGRLGESDTFPAVWQSLYPNAAIPKIRYWVLFNNKLRTIPMVVPARWPAIITRSLESAIRASTLTSIRHLYAMAEISRLKRNADIEVRVVAIPSDWAPPVVGNFNKQSMNELADLGEKMGADPASWSTDAPLY